MKQLAGFFYFLIIAGIACFLAVAVGWLALQAFDWLVNHAWWQNILAVTGIGLVGWVVFGFASEFGP